MEYRLANGSAITDEDIERECAEYESGSWEGNLVNLRADYHGDNQDDDVFDGTGTGLRIRPA